MNTAKSDKKVTVIAGDSIVKHLHGWRLSDTNNHVVVKSFAGATIEDYGGLPEACDSQRARVHNSPRGHK